MVTAAVGIDNKLTIGLKPCCIASSVVALTHPDVLTPQITRVSTFITYDRISKEFTVNVRNHFETWQLT